MERFLSELIRAYPSLADRPSRMGATILIDAEAPFQIDIDGGLIVLDVSWDALDTVLPRLRWIASSVGIAMFLPHEGRLLLPDDPTDFRVEWQKLGSETVAMIDAMVDDAHMGRVHSAAEMPSDGSDARESHEVGQVNFIYLWKDRCTDLDEAVARVVESQSRMTADVVDPRLRSAQKAIAELGSMWRGDRPQISVQELGDLLLIRVPADRVDVLGHEVIAVALQNGLQAYDPSAAILTP